MARQIKILKIHPSNSELGAIEIVGDFTKMFQGRFYLDDSGNRKQIYEHVTPPAGYETVVATTFTIIRNSRYSGTYTVHTPIDSSPKEKSSIFTSGNTFIRINESLGASSLPTDLTDGYITNITTYLIKVNDIEYAIPPRHPFEYEFAIKLYGKDTLNWGEGYAQNFGSLVSNFASVIPPANPEDGQLWFDKNILAVKIWYEQEWHLLSSGGGTSSQYKHTQIDPQKVWVINHSLDIESPFISIIQVFVDRGAGAQQMMPANISYDSANQTTITFSKPEKGWALIQT